MEHFCVFLKQECKTTLICQCVMNAKHKEKKCGQIISDSEIFGCPYLIFSQRQGGLEHTLGSLSTSAFEMRTATGRNHFAY